MKAEEIKEKLKGFISAQIEGRSYMAAGSKLSTYDYLVAYQNAVQDFYEWLDETAQQAPDHIADVGKMVKADESKLLDIAQADFLELVKVTNKRMAERDKEISDLKEEISDLKEEIDWLRSE